MVSSSAGRSSSVLGLLFREGSALIFAALVWFAIWGGYAPPVNTPEQAFQVALIIGLIALAYVGMQAVVVVSAPLGRTTRYLLDLILSLVPLAVVGYAAGLSISGYQPISLYQKGVLWFGGAATLIDVVLFTWFNMKVNKLASGVVRIQ
jgi:hypothetical protein